MDLPPELPSANITLTAQCFCKSVHFTITLPSSALPLPVHLCHCHICRYTHGTPCIFHAPLPKGVAPEFISPSSLETSLTGYEHPQAASTRFFCSTCGCHIGDRDVPDSSKPEKEEHLEWRVATSIFSSPGLNPSQASSGSDWSPIFQIRSHVFANPRSSPNGLYNWLPAIGSRPLHIWNPPDDSPDFPISALPTPEKRFNEAREEVLLAECHCSGVSFTIPRPSTVLGKSTLPDGWKDLVRTYLPPSSKAGESDTWSALLDLCDDCRLVDGTHVIGWTFIPLNELHPEIKTDLRHGTLKTFKSSSGILRAFCSVCGATVFFLNEERRWRPDSGQDQGVDSDTDYIVVDIATGILRAPGGVAAEEWLTWRTGRVGWLRSGERYDASFARSLAKGFADWGVKTHGKAIDFAIP
ncbi:DUF636 domain protein [Naviculisporaceae sp. PSN 640]